jgi:outer membrane PBP1 activator LpoA protein
LLDQGVRLIVGPLFSTSVTTVAEEARLRQVPVVAFSNNIAVAAPGVYVMGLSPEAQVERIVNYTVSQQLYRFAALAPDSPYGDAALSALQSAVFQSGGELVQTATYNADGTNMTDVVRRLADYDRRVLELEKERTRLEANGDAASKLALEHLENRDTLNPPEYDAVLIAAGGRDLLTIAPLLAYYDVDSLEVRYLGTALWEDENLGLEPTMQGGWFSAPPRGLWDGFQARYRQVFGTVPPRVVSLGYDATALAAILARRAPDPMAAGVFSEAALTDPNGFAGMDGIFRFLPDGNVQRVLTVYEVRPDGFRELDPAPNTFEHLTGEGSLIN